MIFTLWTMQIIGPVHLPLQSLDDFYSSGNADNGLVHLPLWNHGDFHYLDNKDYGPFHFPLWNLDDFHSLDNPNYRFGPSATIKPVWFSFFGQCRLTWANFKMWNGGFSQKPRGIPKSFTGAKLIHRPQCPTWTSKFFCYYPWFW